MPTTRIHVKKPLKLAVITTIAVAIIIGITSPFSYLFDNSDCQRYNYNEKLNGGVKNIGGKKYTINICGSGVDNSHFFGDGMDTVQLTIIDEQGEILAKRRYKVFWEGQPGHEPIVIGKDSITYQDDQKQKDYTVAVPPKLMDWIRVRVGI